jgi:hypothetical protein
VRKVVPTLTSTSTEIYLPMAGAKQLSDTSFILAPARAVRPTGVCSRHCIALHRGACRGELQAWRERRWCLQVPEVWLKRDANIAVEAENVRVCAIRRPPRGRGTASSFYRPRGGGLQSCHTVLGYMWRHGVQCRGVGDRPGESCFWRSAAANPVLV